MVKKIATAGSAADEPQIPTPRFLATAVEAVVRAGDIQMAQFGTGFRVDKKGAIDLVTEVDVEVERMFRALVAERFPDHDVLAEEIGARADRRAATAGCSIRSTAPPTSRTACRSSAPRWRSRSTARRWSAPSTTRTARSCSPPRSGVGAWLNGRRCGVRGRRRSSTRCSSPDFPTTCTREADEFLQGVRPACCAARARCGAWGRRPSTSAGWRPGAWTDSGRRGCKPWDTAAGALIVQEAGGRVTAHGRRCLGALAPRHPGTNGLIHDEVLAIIRRRERGRSDRSKVAGCGCGGRPPRQHSTGHLRLLRVERDVPAFAHPLESLQELRLAFWR